MEILYHYCSPNTFCSMIENKSFWLSSLTQSNDYNEGRLLSDWVIQIASELDSSIGVMELLKKLIAGNEKNSDALGLCLSEDGDLLSQWRGYAVDGSGISIGFSHDYLKWLADETQQKNGYSFKIEKIIYSEEEQHDALLEFIANAEKCFKKVKTKPIIKYFPNKKLATIKREVVFESATDLIIEVMELYRLAYTFKAKSFREEKEWRLISYVLNDDAEYVLYRSVPTQIIPYRNFQMFGLERSPISEVILGPKHITPVTKIQQFLKKAGFGEVRVRRSDLSYR